VEIAFQSGRLAAAAQSLSEATRLFGAPIGRKYMQRLAIMRSVDKFSELYGHRSLRLYPLKGDRAGNFAITLTGNYRLIVERISEDAARILAVEDYHGD
jgi:plasmid maintenance system killer protein